MIESPAQSIAHDSALPQAQRADWAVRCALLALAIMLVSIMTVRQFPDPDMFHEMALWRHVLETGAFPASDPFSYTPSKPHVIHHEWGTGAVLYHVVDQFGDAGLLALRYLLTAIVAALCIWCARRRGAQWTAILIVCLPAVILGHIGLFTVRAQLFTLVAMAALLLMLDADRNGKRWWVVPWLVIYVAWVNLHAGFAVGLALCGAHWVEQVIRTRSPQWHLVATGLAIAALTFVNPYGWRYVPFVWEAVAMDRPLIPEWWPLWKASGLDLIPLFVWFFAAVLIVYSIGRRGVKQLPGILIVLLCAYAAIRHHRHASLLAVALLAYVPLYLETTPLMAIVNDLWQRHRRVLTAFFAVISVALLFVMPNSPWRLQTPRLTENLNEHQFIYPISAVNYLHEVGFSGNILTPFSMGAYISWKLHPHIKVAQDGRYEVAYPPELIEEFAAFYNAGEGWQEVLAKYATDVLLVAVYQPLFDAMKQHSDWQCVYRDDEVSLYARPGLELPFVDRTGQQFEISMRK